MNKVATGLASGTSADPDLAAQAVKAAMAKIIDTPTAVLLFLTSEFAADPASAIKAAAKTAGCTQVIGCSATGIFTEEDWILDSPAAAAMVFSDTASLSTQINNDDQKTLLTLAAPSAMNTTWLNKKTARFGGISGDATGHGPFSVWKSGKGATEGHCEVSIKDADIAVAASHGLKRIASPQKITEASGHDVQSIAGITALNSLKTAWQAVDSHHQALPYHQLVAMTAPSLEAFQQDSYNVATIISNNDQNEHITLSKKIKAGSYISWALRDANAAQLDIVKTVNKLQQQLDAKPSFAMLFSCLGRGPSFYDGSDQDLELLKTLHPALPIIGFYGNGEIAPIADKNELLQYSAVVALFSEMPRP